MRRVGYLISMVGLLLVFTVKIGQAHRSAVRRQRVMSGCKISPLEGRD